MSLEIERSSQVFSSAELEEVRALPLPHHVAVMMDGNRRWARKNIGVKNILDGHWVGARVLQDIIAAALELGIKVLTVFCFSTENWGRSQVEVTTLLYLFETYLKENRQKLVEQGVRFHTIGDLSPFPDSLQNELHKAREATHRGENLELVGAFNYGARDEMVRAVQKMARKCVAGEIEPGQINEQMVKNHLDTASFADPDLLIRTSKEMRVSNFLLWQIAYAELYMAETYWPDFTPQEFLKAIKFYQKRERRKGK